MVRIATCTIRALIMHPHGIGRLVVTTLWTTANGLAEGWIGTRTTSRTIARTTTKVVSPRITTTTSVMSIMRRSATVTRRGRTVPRMRMMRRIAMRRVAVRRRPTVGSSSTGISWWRTAVIRGMIAGKRRGRRATAAATAILLSTTSSGRIALTIRRSTALSTVTAFGTHAVLGTHFPRRRGVGFSIFTRHARRRRAVRVVSIRRRNAGGSIAEDVLPQTFVRWGVMMPMGRRRPVAVSRRRIPTIRRHVMRGRSVAIARRRRMTMRGLWRCTSLIGARGRRRSRSSFRRRLLALAPAMLASRRRRFGPRFLRCHGRRWYVLSQGLIRGCCRRSVHVDQMTFLSFLQGVRSPKNYSTVTAHNCNAAAVASTTAKLSSI